MKVKIKKLSENALLPKKATEGAAAYDVYLPNDYMVVSGRCIIPLDFAIELPLGYEAKLEPRSGYSAKGMEGFKFGVGNKERFNADVMIGKIDSDYRGNVGVMVNNHETFEFSVKKGTRIAQLTIYKVEDASFDLVEELSETERADGGFGHTNK